MSMDNIIAATSTFVFPLMLADTRPMPTANRIDNKPIPTQILFFISFFLSQRK